MNTETNKYLNPDLNPYENSFEDDVIMNEVDVANTSLEHAIINPIVEKMFFMKYATNMNKKLFTTVYMQAFNHIAETPLQKEITFQEYCGPLIWNLMSELERNTAEEYINFMIMWQMIPFYNMNCGCRTLKTYGM